MAVPQRAITRPRSSASQRSWARVLAQAMNQIEVSPVAAMARKASGTQGAHATQSTEAAVASASTRTRCAVGAGAAAASSAPGRPPMPNAAISAP